MYGFAKNFHVTWLHLSLKESHDVDRAEIILISLLL